MSGALVTGLAFLVAPGPSWTFWLDNPAGGVSGSPFFTNQTFQAVLVRAGVDGPLKTVLWLVLSVGRPGARRSGDPPRAAPLALMATAGVALLVSPTSWSHHWVWVAPFLLVAAASAWRARSLAWLGVTVLSAAVFVVAPHQLDLPHAGTSWTIANRSSAAPTSGSRCSFSWRCGGGGVRHADVVAYCLAKPGAVADTPWEEDLVAKVGGKIFAFLGGDGVGLKCGRDADEAAELRQRFPDTATVMAYIGRYGWNSIALDDAIGIPDDDELRSSSTPPTTRSSRASRSGLRP